MAKYSKVRLDKLKQKLLINGSSLGLEELKEVWRHIDSNDNAIPILVEELFDRIDTYKSEMQTIRDRYLD